MVSRVTAHPQSRSYRRRRGSRLTWRPPWPSEGREPRKTRKGTKTEARSARDQTLAPALGCNRPVRVLSCLSWLALEYRAAALAIAWLPAFRLRRGFGGQVAGMSRCEGSGSSHAPLKRDRHQL